MRWWLAPVMIFAAGAPAALAQDSAAASAEAAPSAPVADANRVFDLVLRDRLMPALALLEHLLETDSSPATLSRAPQWWGFSGDVATADALFARSISAPETPPEGSAGLPELSAVQPEPAIAAIVRAAAGRRVVMINEAHHSPRHRAFVHALMLALREAGFTHLAAETFMRGQDRLTDNGVPTLDTGYYTRDPVFADLVRQAVAAGYGLVPYEIGPGQYPPAGTAREAYIAIREQAQADNLKAALDADPAMRVLVHVGFGHLNETEEGASWHAFAGRLKAMTGDDPLTIDQVEGTPQAVTGANSPLYRAFVARFGEAAVPVAITKEPARLSGNYLTDLAVIHPPERWVDGRPGWLAMDGYRKRHPVALAPLDERSLVRAFVAGDPDKAIAMDQMLVPAGADGVTLMLPAGNYRLVRQTVADADLPLGEVTVR
jgi:hypothetical protein